MDENEVVINLMELLESSDEFFEENEIPFQIERIRTFEEACLLTHNKGFVIEVCDSEGNKAEYQLQVIRSR